MARDRGEVHRGYDRAIGGLRNIHRAKLEEYGLDRYQETDPRWAMIMCYSDVYRKNIRLRQLTDSIVADEEIDPAALKDAYQDLANYAIMAVQEIDHHYPKGTDHV